MRSGTNRKLTKYRDTWCVSWRESGTTKRKSLGTKDKQDAERLFLEYQQKLDGSLTTINDIIDYWIEEKQNLKSIDNAVIKFKPVRAFFGYLSTQHITRKTCRDYIKSRGVSNSTIRNELAVLRCAVNYHDAHNQSIFEFPPTTPAKDHYLTKADYCALLSSCESHHQRLFIVMGLHTGARSNAILDLTWKQVDFNRLTINFIKGDHKNKRRSIIPINDILLEFLQEAYEASTCDYVVEYGGGQIKSIRKGFSQTAKRAGIYATPHMLRHTCAMVIAESGRAMQEVSQYLGHTGKTTTERVYASFSPNYLREAAQALHDWHVEALNPCVPCSK